MIIEGILAFVNLEETEFYQGKDTENYSVVVTLDEENAAKLEAEGVKLRDYKDTKQRKFKTKYKNFKIVDVNNEEYMGKVGYGDKVRIQYATGEPSPANGAPTYLNALKVLEACDRFEDDEDF